MTIWNPRFEKLAREELEQLQLERLQSTLNRANLHVAYYQKVFDREGIVPEAVANLADLQKIPFTDRSTLRAAYPYDMFAVPLRDVVRLQTSAGRTGEPIVVGYTRNDIAHWTELTARLLAAAGVGAEDVIQIAFDYGLFPGALGVHDQFRRRRADAGHGRVGLSHHVGLHAHAETARLVGRHRGVVRQHDRQFTAGRFSRERPARQRPDQPPERRRPHRQAPLPVEQVDFHGDRDSFLGGCS